jgi:secretion/DNA translocation related TadE-like protein
MLPLPLPLPLPLATPVSETAPVAAPGPTTRFDDSGAGTVLGVAVLGAFLSLTLLLAPGLTLLTMKQRLAGAADASALAAADARLGVVGDYPCPLASKVARANGATLAACEFDGLIVTVSVSHLVWGVSMTATATAGPPG